MEDNKLIVIDEGIEMEEVGPRGPCCFAAMIIVRG